MILIISNCAIKQLKLLSIKDVLSHMNPTLTLPDSTFVSLPSVGHLPGAVRRAGRPAQAPPRSSSSPSPSSPMPPVVLLLGGRLVAPEDTGRVEHGRAGPLAVIAMRRGSGSRGKNALTHSFPTAKQLFPRFLPFFYAIFSFLRPEHDCFVKFTSCSTYGNIKIILWKIKYLLNIYLK